MAFAKEEGRPSRWKDGQARSFLHDSTHHFSKERGSKRLTSGNPGAIWTRCEADSHGAPTHGAEECRLIRRPLCHHRRIAHGWVKSWSRGQHVRLLLLSAQVEYRPTLAPPISMNTLSSPMRQSTISCPAHCLYGARRAIVGMA